MNKYIILLFTGIIISLCTTQCDAQTSYPAGCYLTFDEIQNKKPSRQYNIKIEEVPEKERMKRELNRYLIESTDGTLKKKILKTGILAISLNDTLFINCERYGYLPGFSNAQTDGRFLAFLASRKNTGKNAGLGAAAFSFGLIGAAIYAASTGGQSSILTNLYVLDTEANQLQIINKTVLEIMLRQHPPLREAYIQEENISSLNTIIHYIQNLNIALAKEN